MDIFKKIKNDKIVLWVSLSIFLIASVIYYFNIYFKNNEIIFSKSDSLILIILGSSIIATSIVLIFLIFKVMNLNEVVNETKKLILNLKEEISDIEDNDIALHRTTQLMIMNLSKKLGVDGNSDKRY